MMLKEANNIKKSYKIFAGVLTILFLSWAIVTAYFYNHHIVTTKSMRINGWNIEAEESGGIQFKEIVLVNKQSSWESAIPSDFQINIINKLPTQKLKWKAFNVARFYRKPYTEYENGWRLSIASIALKEPDQSHVDLRDILPTRVFLKLNDEQDLRLSGGSFLSEDENNVLYCGFRRDNVDPDVQPEKIVWYWEEDSVFELDLEGATFETIKYSFFDSKPRETDVIFPFYKEVLDAYMGVQKGKKVKSELITNNKILGQFNLMKDYSNNSAQFGFPEYVGNHLDYPNVFSMEIVYVLDISDDNTVNMEQILYFVEQDGRWKMIDVQINKTNLN